MLALDLSLLQAHLSKYLLHNAGTANLKFQDHLQPRIACIHRLATGIWHTSSGVPQRKVTVYDTTPILPLPIAHRRTSSIQNSSSYATLFENLPRPPTPIYSDPSFAIRKQHGQKQLHATISLLPETPNPTIQLTTKAKSTIFGQSRGTKSKVRYPPHQLITYSAQARALPTLRQSSTKNVAECLIASARRLSSASRSIWKSTRGVL